MQDDRSARTWRSSSSAAATTSTRCRASSTSCRTRRPQAGDRTFTFARETPAAAGHEPSSGCSRRSARFGVGEAPRWSPYLDLGFAGGVGPTKFYFLQDPTLRRRRREPRQRDGGRDRPQRQRRARPAAAPAAARQPPTARSPRRVPRQHDLHDRHPRRDARRPRAPHRLRQLRRLPRPVDRDPRRALTTASQLRVGQAAESCRGAGAARSCRPPRMRSPPAPRQAARGRRRRAGGAEPLRAPRGRAAQRAPTRESSTTRVRRIAGIS